MFALRFICLLFLYLLLIVAETKVLPKDSIPLAKAIFACKLNVHKDVGYCRSDTSEDYGCICSNKDAIDSFVGCFAYTQENSTQAIDFFVDFCKEYGNTTVDMDDICTAYNNYTVQGYFNSSELMGINNTNRSTTTQSGNYEKVDTGNYTLSLESSIDQFLVNWDNTFYYGGGILGYWALVLIIGAISNWSRYMFPGLMTDLNGPFSNWLRKHVLLPATIGRKKSQNYKYFRIVEFYMPSRFESFILIGFTAVCVVTLSINTYFAQGDEVIFSNYYARLRYVANRTGTCSTMMMPLVILFAGRNNILQFVTRWNYSVFITFHRHIARMMFAFVMIHAVCFTIALGPAYASVMSMPFMIWGTAATVLAAIMLFQGMLYLRRRWYEVFVLSHVVMAVFYVVGTWRHVVDLGYMWYVYASVAVWVLDRLIRLVRLLAFGFPEATVTLMSDETLKITIPRPEDWKPIPGAHVFIHFLTPSTFYQNHPFTIGLDEDRKINLYCKVKNGITLTLYKKLVDVPNRTTKIRVGVEGPYGETSDARKSDTIVYIAGGNGIPGMYSEATHLASRYSTTKSAKKVKLYWVVREFRSLNWFFDELDKLRRSPIETTIYITQPNNATAIEELAARVCSSKLELKSCYSMGEGDSKTIGSYDLKHHESKVNHMDQIQEAVAYELDPIRLIGGRPNIHEIINYEVTEAPGSIAFVTCGHPAMVDDVRAEVVDAIGKHENRIDFYEQLLGWS
ncbi:putative ferric reductase transmembrane component [Candida viswanathii]|uniref:Putative ferric reductase transmembrane component n=1 Tax=Candida viswanathii TaxID=5486 RepID=A0A367Y933_9ASCO|nr:putative ferric reductase transmembrane component [Candida viswanathii]